MPVPKLKNLVILILLMANLLLVLLVVPGRLASRQAEEALRESLCQLYAREQISLSASAIPETATLYMLELKEDTAATHRAAEVLLGEPLQMQDDSTRYLSLYQSPRGTCSISRSGAFAAQLTDQPEAGDLAKSSRKLLQNMGFSHGKVGEPVRVRAGVYTVTADQSVLGVPVFSGGLTLTWSNSRLTALDGTFFTGASSLTRVSDESCLSASDALVAFLSARYSLGWVGSAVTQMEQGYIRSETAAAAAVRLTPVWRLTTDTGSFLINGMTAEVTAA
jgi:regulatory protein YycI of two-component signal transduction system YycFG